MLIVKCPICDNVPAQRTLEKYQITVKSSRESTLGGLCVFQCPAGHIFFVRASDLGMAFADVTAA